jgi:hypothetical protein
MPTPDQLLHYVHTNTNLEANMNTLVQSKAFCHAAQSTFFSAPLRGI